MAGLAREDLFRFPRRPLADARNRTKADVLLIESEAGSLVVKDFRGRGVVVRNTIGRFSIARECRAYARLGSTPGVPAFHGRIDPFAFACEYVPGRPLREHARRSQPAGLFMALGQRLESIHARGVAIADLHHRNVLVRDSDGSPFFVDFSLAIVRPDRWNLPGRWIFSRALELDRLALERIRARYEAATPTGSRSSVLRKAAGGNARSGQGANLPRGDAVLTPSDTSDRRAEITLPRSYRLGRWVKSWIDRARGKQ